MIVYRIYKNDGAGGPVDYGTVVATVSGPPWSGPSLPAPSDTTFAVRAYDDDAGLDDMGRDARCRVVLDAGGVDVTRTPGPPSGLSAIPGPAGVLEVEWADHPGPRADPAGYRIWATRGAGPADYASPPAATVPAAPGAGQRAYAATISGLTPGAAHAVAVRAYNAAGDDGGTDWVPATPAATGPDAPGSVTVGPAVGPLRNPGATRSR